MPLPPSASRTFSLLLASTLLSVSSLLAVSFVAHAQSRGPDEAPWVRPLAEADRAYAQGRWTEATEHFAEADRLLGGYPYQDYADVYDDQGQWIHAATRQPVRDRIQCPWALAQLQAPVDGDDAEDERAIAVARAELGCSASQKVFAAHHLGDDLQAALRSQDPRVAPAPGPRFGREAWEWARAVYTGSFPLARDAAEAARFVRAHAAAAHGLATSCGAPYGLRTTRPGERLPLPNFDEEYEEPEPVAPFESGTPDAIAFVTCAYSEPISPYEDPGMGPGADTIEYVLVRQADGVRVAGWFRGFPQYECWTGVVQGLVAHQIVSIGGGRRLYTLERVEGYTGMDDLEESHISDELVVCDLTRPAASACRTLLVGLEENEVVYPDDPDSDEEPVAHAHTWSARPRFTRGRVSLSSIRSAPPAMRVFGGRGLTLDEFFTAPAIPTTRMTFETATLAQLVPTEAAGSTAPATSAAAAPATPATAPSTSPASRTAASCPWRIADPDGQTNVRPEAGTGRPAIGTVPNGTSVIALERRGRWWRIGAPIAGWIWAANVRQSCP